VPIDALSQSPTTQVHPSLAAKAMVAVPILIGLLENSEKEERVLLRQSLAQLTHRVGNKYHLFFYWDYPVSNEFVQWRDWWAVNGNIAEIFDTGHCLERKPLF
jgi:hypothetical protein